MSDTANVGGFVITGSAQDIARAVFGPRRVNPEQVHLNTLRRAHTMSKFHIVASKMFPSEAKERLAKAAVERSEARAAVKAIRALRA
jgi:hypothetical protein